MSVSRKMEERALSADERELVDKSRHPVIQSLSDAEISGLAKLVRERRDRARGIAERRRREMRGKAGARGAHASQSDEGSKLKQAVLAAGMRRLNAEITRRQRLNAKLALIGSAQKALAMKYAAERADPAFNTRRSHEGLRKKVNAKTPNLIRPSERGRLRKAGAVAQAKRDARPTNP